jgi:hypothetical protein
MRFADASSHFSDRPGLVLGPLGFPQRFDVVAKFAHVLDQCLVVTNQFTLKA